MGVLRPRRRRGPRQAPSCPGRNSTLSRGYCTTSSTSGLGSRWSGRTGRWSGPSCRYLTRVNYGLWPGHGPGGGARAGARALRGGGDLPERLGLASGDGAPGAPSPAPAAAGTLLTGGALRASLGQPFWLLAWRPQGSSGGTYWASGFGPSASGRESGVGPLGVEFALVGPLDGENTRRGPGMSVLPPGSRTPFRCGVLPPPPRLGTHLPLDSHAASGYTAHNGLRPTGEVCLPILNSFKYPGCRSTHMDFL